MSKKNKRQRPRHRTNNLVSPNEMKSRGWLPFQEIPMEKAIASYPEKDRDIARESLEGARMFINNLYQVTARWIVGGYGRMCQLAVTRIDQEPIHDWRELQKIKNWLLGDE